MMVRKIFFYPPNLLTFIAFNDKMSHTAMFFYFFQDGKMLSTKGFILNR